MNSTDPNDVSGPYPCALAIFNEVLAAYQEDPTSERLKAVMDKFAQCMKTLNAVDKDNDLLPGISMKAVLRLDAIRRDFDHTVELLYCMKRALTKCVWKDKDAEPTQS